MPADRGPGARLEFGDGQVLYSTRGQLFDERLIEVLPARVALWREDFGGVERAMYSLSPKGRAWTRGREIDYRIELERRAFVPLVDDEPTPGAAFGPGGAELGRLFLVQYVSPALPAFRERLTQEGGQPVRFFPRHADIVLIPSDPILERIRALPFVRWVGRYRPEYRLHPDIVANGLVRSRYVIRAREPGPRFKGALLQRILDLGGTVQTTAPSGDLLQAMLAPRELLEVAAWDEVLYIDPAGALRFYGPAARPGAPRVTMEHVRADGGADLLEADAYLLGEGVRIEVADSGILEEHADFPVPLYHDTNGTSVRHGTRIAGIVFGRGTGDWSARGLLPNGSLVFAAVEDPISGIADRYTHTQELLGEPYECVAQSCSWGVGPDDSYSSQAADLDRIAFELDALILQALGDGTPREQLAWAKNVLTVGALQHNNNGDPTDDLALPGVEGFASDGRVKPDLCYWGDEIYTTAVDSIPVWSRAGYSIVSLPTYGDASGTSAATAEVAGYAGLVFQLWHAGLLGVAPAGGSVFESRPHSTTARALLINSAAGYEFEPGSEVGRAQQGWGRPDVGALYARRAELQVIDEEVVLELGESATWSAEVPTGTSSLRVTLVYLDPPGAPGATLHRTNDLSLLVTDPAGTEYWGNHGLDEGAWSLAGGASNTTDVVENVFVENPDEGTWKIVVYADEINADGHRETPEIQDVDFALVVCGAQLGD